MKENKRIFLTGALIAGLLLLTPFYLQLIGVQQDVPSDFGVNPAEEEALVLSFPPSGLQSNSEGTTAQLDSEKPLANTNNIPSATIKILTQTLDLEISNDGGGSIKKSSSCF